MTSSQGGQRAGLAGLKITGAGPGEHRGVAYPGRAWQGWRYGGGAWRARGRGLSWAGPASIPALPKTAKRAAANQGAARAAARR